MNLYEQLSQLFTVAPGNLIYHLALAVSILAALQAVLIGRRTTSSPAAGRMLLGFSLLLVGQLALFASSGLFWQGAAAPHLFLPPFDRAITAFTLVWILWLWCAPQISRLLDGLTGLLTLGVVLLYLVTFTSWSAADPNLAFNQTLLDQIWAGFSLAMLLGGLLVLIIERPAAAGLGVGFILIQIAGYTVHLLWNPAIGDFSMPIRLAQLCSYPLLPALTLRLFEDFKTPAEQLEQKTAGDKKNGLWDSRTVQAWLMLAGSEPDQIPNAITHAICRTAGTDLCLLVTTPDARGDLSVVSGYDLIREENLLGGILRQEKIGALASAIQRGRPLRIISDGKSSPELEALSDFLGLNNCGNLISIPLSTPRNVWGAALLLSPYSNRIWSAEDQAAISAAADGFMQILEKSNRPAAASANVEAMQSELSGAQKRLEILQQDHEALLHEMAQLRSIAAQPASTPDTDLEALLAVQKENQETITRLETENAQLHSTFSAAAGGQSRASGAQIQQLEEELRLTLEEVARLQNALAETNMKLLEQKKLLNRPVLASAEEREVIASIVQELRQPISSILGYTDLLLAESAGILGALQRKFLERVRSSTERMRTLLDDLLQITSMQNGLPDLFPQPLEVSTVIDQVINEASSQLREKNLTLHVDLPDELPRLYADRDAIQQILMQLIQNASVATPMEGTISLRARVQDEGDNNAYLLLQVTDSGGGIPAADLPRVFSRLYRAENPLIQGIGDTGVGLSIAKTLVEAHGGRIWVDSDFGKSTTFSVLLPTQSGIPAKDEAHT